MTEQVTLPDFFHNTHAIYHMMVDYAPVYQDLRLEEEYGVRHIHPELGWAMPLADGRCLGIYQDVDKTCASIASFSQRDADSYRRLRQKVHDMMKHIVAPMTFIKPELEVWHMGQFWLVRNLIEQGLVKPPYFIQFVMGFQSGAYASPKELLHLLECAPKPSVYSVLGVGIFQNPMIAMGIVPGINVRTGMEDNVLYKKGELCKDNAQLVEKVARMARDLNREIATPKQARQMLGLSEKPSRYD